MTEFILVLTNTSSQTEAQEIADAAMDNHLAAAVQVIGPVKSTYRWKDNIEKAEEWICLLKTSRELYEELEHTIQLYHSYELPGVLAIPVIAGSETYLNWNESHLKKSETLKEQMLREFDEAHEKLISVATTAHLRGASYKGGWGPREVLAHIIGWESEARHRIPQLIAGATPKEYDHEASNIIAVAAIDGQSFEQVRDTLRRAHRRLLHMLMKQEDAVFAPETSTHRRVKAMARHSVEHAQELEELP